MVAAVFSSLASPRQATASLLQTFNEPTVTSGDQFGASVAIDGNNVLIGASLDDTNGTDTGQAFLFDAFVPEPSSGLLLGMAMLLIAGFCRPAT